jgi:copper(I)-binding protein
MEMGGGFMQMRPVEAYEAKAGEILKLSPDGHHFMLMGLKNKLRAGSSFPITVNFEKAGPVTIQVLITAPGTAPEAAAKDPS